MCCVINSWRESIMRNQGLIYIGLFLIAFGLYASQLKKKPHVENKPVETPMLEPTPASASQARIQVLYEKILADKMFTSKIGGIKLTPARPPVNNDFTITFTGDEIFTNEGFSIHESLASTLDFLAETIKSEHGLMVEISGYADANSVLEVKPSDYGSSALAFSFARAEWLAHYFEQTHGISVSKTLILRGMGAVPQGKKVELRFYFR